MKKLISRNEKIYFYISIEGIHCISYDQLIELDYKEKKKFMHYKD
jgi:hypothetical protein